MSDHYLLVCRIKFDSCCLTKKKCTSRVISIFSDIASFAKRCMAKMFCKFSVKRWVTMFSRLNSSLTVLDLELYLLYFFADWQYRHLLRFYFFIYCHSASILTLCFSPDSSASIQKSCFSILTQCIEAVHCLISSVLRSLF